MKQRYKLQVEAHFNSLSEIATFIRQHTIASGFDDQSAYAVEMAVDEACTNIIEHAYQDTDSGHLTLICEQQADGLQIVIFDQGTPFDPASLPDFNPATPLEQRGRRGMGMFFIYELMDSVEYRFNTHEGNRLTLFKSGQPNNE
jgi:serine/threonine-protein kinase RsbW